MIAAGIDLGGTKIETQVFDRNWDVVARQRVATPKDYPALVTALAEQIKWAKSHGDMPVGIGAAGLVNPATGLALTANICANGMPLPKDIMAAAGARVTYMNDCRALALSEAIFGAGRGHRVVAGLILGTGVGGGLTIDGKLQPSGRQISGEYGHMSAPAHLVAAHDLPIVTCGCGALGCIETLIAGPGMTRLSQALIGRALSAPEIAEQRHMDAGAAKVWDVWLGLTAELLQTLSRISDPDVVVLGGGLSKIPHVTDELQAKLDQIQFNGFETASVHVAEGGDTSGARGAAFAAWQAQGSDDGAAVTGELK